MLKRSIEKDIREYLTSGSNKLLVVEGARQIGKSFIIRKVGQELFPNYIEINFAEDAVGSRYFANVQTTGDFYLQLSMVAGERLGTKADTLVFLDEIQQYGQFLTLIKFLKQDDRYSYIASGSMLGLALRHTTSIPVGSMSLLRMYPLDFREFLFANGFNETAIDSLRDMHERGESCDDATHRRLLDLFHKYLLSGGMPDAVKSFVTDNNIVTVRAIQSDIARLYRDDATKYEDESSRRLQIGRIYDMIPSNMGQRKKRVVAKDIEEKKGKRFTDYREEFEYLLTSGIALSVRAVPTPVFPLVQSVNKNLMKLYLNDVGILTGQLYRNNIRAILDDEKSVNLGAVYESVVAQELAAHGHGLYYYDNRNKGEVDFLIDDHDTLSVLPIEVKSGKDYTVHSALNTFLKNEDYHVKRGIVLSEARERRIVGQVLYLPIYDVMFL